MVTYANVIGVDRVNPILDENSLWRILSIDDIWLGVNGANPQGNPRIVAKVNDYVIRPKTGEIWIVVSVDPVTLVPTLEPKIIGGNSGEMSKDDILFGVGPGSQAQLLRVYINRSTWPYKMTVDTHCFVGGTANAYAVIYRGGDPSLGGEPVSRMYDNSENFLGVEVPLELVAIDSHGTSVLKVVQECWTNTDIKDGEALYIIFYSAAGVPQSKSMLLAENTTYIRGLDIERRFVTGISLESPWLSSADSNVLRYPLNIPTNALDLVGVVNYSVGPPLRLPVDGTKFSMLGLNHYLSSIPGEKFDLVLRYQLSPEEVSYAGQGMYVNDKVTQAYTVITQPIEPGYTLKLYPYPFWDAALQGYRLKFYLYNLARNMHQDVTALVKFSPEFPAFDPRGFGLAQTMQVNLNLRDISMAYMPMVHTQMFSVSLFSDPQSNDTPWIVHSQLSPGLPGFGRDAYARRVDMNQFFVHGDYATRDEWLKAMYYDTDPIVDRRSETKAPEPTHFWVSVNDGANWYQYRIDDSWNSLIRVPQPVSNYRNVLMRFTKPGDAGPVELSLASLTIRP